MLPYILKICGLTIVPYIRFIACTKKYTFFVKLCICGLTYRLFIRYKHKLRIDVITYVSTRYRYYRSRSGPSSTGTANIRTSGYPEDIRSIVRIQVPVPYCCTGTVYFALVVEFVGWDPPLDLWDGIPPAGISSRRVTAALGRPEKFHRKVPGRSQQRDPSRNPQMMGVAQRGRLKFLKISFWRIIQTINDFCINSKALTSKQSV